jgi:hypothetical protein
VTIRDNLPTLALGATWSAKIESDESLLKADVLPVAEAGRDEKRRLRFGVVVVRLPASVPARA